MKKNEMMAVETIAKGVKGAYQKPLCTSFGSVEKRWGNFLN